MLRIFYTILFAFIGLIALLPFPILYLLSDFIYLIVYYLLRYRRKVVRENLQNSFPEKTKKDLKSIERKFYHHFCDVFLETIKILHISEEELKKRMVFKNTEEVMQRLDNGANIIFMLGHYGNWEWMVVTRLYFKKEKYVGAAIYKRIRNKYVDEFYLKLRSRFNILCIEKNSVFREIVRQRKLEKQMAMALISDQTPSKKNIHYWTEFLNQDTPFLTGGERMARQTNYELFYVDIQKKKRGYYEADLVLLHDDVKNTPEFMLTEKFARMMEQTILREPAYWLWTHKRWKHKRNNIS